MIADVVKENDLWLIADEVYREFVYDGLPMASFGEFDDIKDRLIIIDSISKRFSACGARVGMLISRNEDIMQSVLKLATKNFAFTFCRARVRLSPKSAAGSK